MVNPSTHIASTPTRWFVMTPRRWATPSAICFLTAAYYLCYEHFPVHVTKDTPLFKATRNGKQGIVTTGGRVVVPFEWRDISPFDENGLAVVSKNVFLSPKVAGATQNLQRRYGVVRRDGRLLIRPELVRCAYAFDQKGELAAVDEAGRLLVFDVNGNRRSPGEWVPSEDRPRFGRSGLMPVTNGKISGWIDRSGKLAVRSPDGLMAVSIFYASSFALVRNAAGKFGSVNMKGDIIVPTDWDQLFVRTSTAPSSKIVIEAIRNDSENPRKPYRTLLRPDGTTILPFAYQKVSLDFHQELIFVTTEQQKAGVFDFEGHEVIPVEFDKWNTMRAMCSTAICCAKDGKVGLFDRSGRVLLPCDQDKISERNFSDCSSEQQVPDRDVILATFQKEGKHGAINGAGEVVIPARFDEAVPLQNHPRLARVREGKLWGCLNAQGETIVPIQYRDVMGMPYTGEIAARAEDHLEIYKPYGSVRVVPCSQPVFPLDFDFHMCVDSLAQPLRYHEVRKDISSKGFYSVYAGGNSRGVISSDGQTVVPAIHLTVSIGPHGFRGKGIANSNAPVDVYLRQYTTTLGRYLPSLVTPTKAVEVLYDFDGNVIWRNDARLFDFLKAFGLSCWGLYCFRRYHVAKREQRGLQVGC